MPSVPPSPRRPGDAERDQGLLDQMRHAVRAAVLSGGQVLRSASAPLVIGVLSASALSPIVAVMAGAGTLLTAGASVLGSIGANIATNVVAEAIETLRQQNDGREPSPDEVRTAIALRVEAAFQNSGPDHDHVRSEIIALFRTAEVADAAVHGAEQTGDRELVVALAATFVEIMAAFAEFGAALGGAHLALENLREDVRQEAARHVVDRERARRTEADLGRVLDLLQDMRDARPPLARRKASATPRASGPYMGLAAFQERDEGVFFGRRTMTRRLLDRLIEHIAEPGILLVIGPSGAGKSSLLRAGLLAAAANGRLTAGSHGWPRMIMTPTADPIGQLSLHLASLAGIAAPSVRAALEARPSDAHLLAQQVISATVRDVKPLPVAARLLLVVDQLEELFVVTDNAAANAAKERDRRLFLEVLHNLATAPIPPDETPGVVVVVGMRADFMDRAVSYPILAKAAERGTFTVGAMTESELTEAIAGPAIAAEVEAPAALLRTVLDDLRSSDVPGGFDTGVLPLLSQLMFVLWQTGELSLKAYRTTGGVADIVETTAEDVYCSLTDSQRATTQRVFLHLSVVNDGLFDRRASTRSGLRIAADDGDLDVVLEAFAAKRLLTLDEENVEIAHEELLRGWARLRDWLAPAATDLALHRDLLADVHTWRDHARDPSYLYRGGQLIAVVTAAARWARQPGDQMKLGAEARDFLSQGLHRERRGRRIVRAVIAAVMTLSVVAAGAAVFATRTAQSANSQHTVALSRQLAAQSRTTATSSRRTAEHLAATAWKLAPSDRLAADAAGDLLDDYNSLLPLRLSTGTSAFSADGRFLTTVDVFGTITQWDPATGRRLGDLLSLPPADAPSQTILSKDGRVFAATIDNSVQVWSSNGGSFTRTAMPSIGLDINDIALSDDGKTLGTVDSSGLARFWNTSTRAEIKAADIDEVGTVSLSQDGSRVAIVGQEQDVRVATVSGRRNAVTLGGDDDVSSLRFSPDGKLLATARDDGAVNIWDTRTGRPAGTPIQAGTGQAAILEYTPDGRYLATAGSDGTVRLWDTATSKRWRSAIPAGSGAIASLSFSPKSDVLAIGTLDGTIRLWNTDFGTLVGSAHDIATDPNASSSITSDGVTAWTTMGGSPDLTLFDTRTGARTKIVKIVTYYGLNGGSLNSDASLVATYDIGAVAQLTNLRKMPPSSVPLPIPEAHWLLFRPHTSQLLVSGEGGNLKLWDLSSHRYISGPMGSGGLESTAIVFSQDGERLAVAEDRSVHRWDVATTRPINTGLTVPAAITAVAFSPDSRTLATTDADGALQLWDIQTGKPRGQAIQAHSGEADAVAFTPDGKIVASSGTDRKIRFWSVANGNLAGASMNATADHIAFDQNGRDLIATEHDGQNYVRIFRRELGRYLHPLAALCNQAGPMDDAEKKAYAPGENLPDACR